MRPFPPFGEYDNSVGMIDAKYQNRLAPDERKSDGEMASTLAQIMSLPVRSIPLVLEGGNFPSDSLVKAQLHRISCNVPLYVRIEGLLDRSTARAQFAEPKRPKVSTEVSRASSRKGARLRF